MEIITSLENKKIKNLCKLNQKKYRNIENKFLIEGEHLVLEAYKAGYLLEIIKTEDYGIDVDVNTTLVTYDVLKKIANTPTPQKVIGVCKKMEEKDIGNKILVLDDLQDPGNLGTIIRSSVAFNIDTIVMSTNTVDVYNDKVLRASEGMIFNINIIRKDLNEFIPMIKNDGYKVYGTKVTGGKSIYDVSFEEKMAFIVGNEGNGVRDSILNLCDEYLYIPMSDKCESLNVGIATGIILYEISK